MFGLRNSQSCYLASVKKEKTVNLNVFPCVSAFGRMGISEALQSDLSNKDRQTQRLRCQMGMYYRGIL